MKKGIVLIISLFFIAALSALVLKNLDDTDKFITNQNHKLSEAQVLAIVKNIYLEAKRNSKRFDDVIGYSYPLKIDEIEASFMISLYDKIDINSLNFSKEKHKDLEELFLANSISGFEELKYIYDNKKAEYKIVKNNILVTNNKQLDDIINTFIKETSNNKILEIKNQLGFLSLKDADENLYELKIEVNYLNQKIEAYYVLNKKGEEKYFELSFK